MQCTIVRRFDAVKVDHRGMPRRLIHCVDMLGVFETNVVYMIPKRRNES